MEIQMGSSVLDKKGAFVGKVDYVIRNSWTGEISKFMVDRPAPHTFFAFTPDDVLDTSDDRVTVAVSLEDLDNNH